MSSDEGNDSKLQHSKARKFHVGMPTARFLSKVVGAYLKLLSDKPVTALGVLVSVGALAAVCVALALRWLVPEPTLVISTFEVPPSVSANAGISGKAFADLLTDDLQLLASKATQRREQNALYRVALKTVPSLFLRDLGPQNINVEVKGLSYDRLIALYDWIRQEQVQITGDVVEYRSDSHLIEAPGKDLVVKPGLPIPQGTNPTPPVFDLLLLRARIPGKGFVEVGPLQANAESLQLAHREMAVRILEVLRPDLAGLYYLHNQELRTALREFQAWERQRKDDSNPYFYEGVVLNELNDSEGAIKAYERSLSIEPNSAEALNNLGIALDKSGRADEALANYHKARDLSPGSPDPLTNIGNSEKARGDYSQAVQNYRAALEHESDNPEARINLCLALSAMKLRSELTEEYKRLNTRDSHPWAELLEGLDSQQQLTALDDFRALFKTDLEYVHFLNDLAGETADISENWDLALIILDKAKSRLSDPETFYLLGRAHEDKEDYKAAIASYEAGLKLRPARRESALIHEGLASVLEAQGKLRDAQEQYFAAMAEDPVGGVGYRLCGLLEKEHKTVEAANCWRSFRSEFEDDGERLPGKIQLFEVPR